MRTHMTEIIPEREELAKLEDELTIVKQQISILENENVDVTNRLRELELNEIKENNILSGISDDKTQNQLNIY